ncbi:hypothetical protein BH10PAT3_BH10PAT3_8490 [soil metagenome]
MGPWHRSAPRLSFKIKYPKATSLGATVLAPALSLLGAASGQFLHLFLLIQKEIGFGSLAIQRT